MSLHPTPHVVSQNLYLSQKEGNTFNDPTIKAPFMGSKYLLTFTLAKNVSLKCAQEL
jgi:hypothetical protein